MQLLVGTPSAKEVGTRPPSTIAAGVSAFESPMTSAPWLCMHVDDRAHEVLEVLEASWLVHHWRALRKPLLRRGLQLASELLASVV